MPSRNAASKLLCWLALCGGAFACSPPPQRYDSEFLAMGTTMQLSLLAASPGQAAQWSAAIQRDLRQQAIDWYPWTTEPTGELRRLNAALAAGKAFTASAPLRQLLQRSRALATSSDGYFDPAVAPLIAAWGFADITRQPTAAPAAALLEHWRRNRPRITDLQIAGEAVRSPRTDLQLDLGAIAKGYALQLALQSLQQKGCAGALLNMGGQPGVLGQTMAEQAGTVAIRQPRAAGALATLRLQAGESSSTSGDYERFVERNGQRLHHLLDPHSGLPVAHTQAVTVVSRDPVLADAGSTALMAAGPDNWRRIARQLGIREALRIDASGAIEVSAALYARLQWNPSIPLRRITRVEL